METVEEITDALLSQLLDDFADRGLSAADLDHGYAGPNLAALREAFQLSGASLVDFDLALNDLERAKLLDTGPRVPYENPPYSTVVFIGFVSKREYVYLTRTGYKTAQKRRTTPPPRGSVHRPHINVNISGGNFQQLPIGVGGTVSQAVTSSPERVFDDIRRALHENAMNDTDRVSILSAVAAMEKAQNTPTFRDRYREFIAQAADYMTLIGPYLPALTSLLGKLSPG